MTCGLMGETDRPMTLVYERDEQGTHSRRSIDERGTSV